MEDWPLTSFCDWNWQLCIRTVFLRTHNCQILTGRNIYMVCYPFKIFTFVVFVIRFCLTILVFLSRQRSFVCTFKIAGPSKSAWTTVAAQYSRIPDGKGANHIEQFYRK